MNNFFEKVYEITRKIPEGRVSTYAEIGRALNTKSYRLIGQALSKNPYAPQVPCHRVVKNTGEVGGFNGSCENSLKIQLLKNEGLVIVNGRIKDFENVLYKF